MMQAEAVTTGRMTAGRLKLRNADRFARQIAKLKDGEYIARIERRRATRSDAQNRWYWGQIVELISEHTGYTPDEVHEVLKARFIPKRLAVCDGNGEIKDELVIGGSTTELNKIDFGEYCEAIRRWAAEDLGVVIPDPDPEYGSAPPDAD